MAEKRQGVEKEGAEARRVPSIRPLGFWYLFMMLMMLWIWQDAFRQVALRTIPYSEFKAPGRGEVSECTIEQDEITGKIDAEARRRPRRRRQGEGGARAHRSRSGASASRIPSSSRISRRRGSSSAACAPGSCRSSSGPGCCRSARSCCSGGCWRGGSAPRASPSWASARAGRGWSPRSRPASPSTTWPAATRPRPSWWRSSTSSATPSATRPWGPRSPRGSSCSGRRGPARRCWRAPWPARPRSRSSR